ncbi:ABC transporter substrate-binding protein [Piscinibacter koreensis]|uniref:ABC transporter substrate-binding protein n=1 Tax=Piscinibacter koreensis TaxID=2742824 RepID=A0A7Y6NP86_9BURK|nr:helical backbone metal receptor [Schlegelella koreensis]NUZ06774.1 ABC transporter substrate-binding protein [Schlegelella koreensis]
MNTAPFSRRAVLRGAAALLGTGLVARVPAAEPIVVRDDRGTEHRFSAPPQRIVTMLPSLTETAWVLGVGHRLVGVDRFSNWPAELARLPHLGGLEDAQIEAIAALRPDVILASTASRAMERLDVLGFTIVRLKSETHADVRRTLDLIARLLGTPDEGARVWARIERELATAAARVPASVRGQRVYFEIGGGPYAAGTSSFIGETLKRLGMNNIVPPELGPFPKLNPEYVVRARPDLIMGVQREQAALVQRPGWGALAAVRNRRLCGFDAADYEMLIRPGPRLGEAAARLADCLSRVATPAAR